MPDTPKLYPILDLSDFCAYLCLLDGNKGILDGPNGVHNVKFLILPKGIWGHTTGPMAFNENKFKRKKEGLFHILRNLPVSLIVEDYTHYSSKHLLSVLLFLETTLHIPAEVLTYI